MRVALSLLLVQDRQKPLYHSQLLHHNIRMGTIAPQHTSLESRLSKGGGGRERRAWYPTIAHALVNARMYM